MISSPLKIGFLASGNGSSAAAIVDAIRDGSLAGEARLMVSNKKDAVALAWARERGVPALCVPTVPDAAAADVALTKAMEAHGVELVVLSGYLRRLGPAILARYAGRILNIHPGPLPDFGGEGMYGRRVHEAVVAASRAASGITVHVVDAEYDHGPTIATQSVPLAAADTAEDLERRVKALEPALFVETLRRVASGDLKLPT